jgi:hypothetical protein
MKPRTAAATAASSGAPERDATDAPEVRRVGAASGAQFAALAALLGRRGLRVCPVAAGDAIPGSYWGDCEAGLSGNHLYLRADTPLHSALHEACHYLCMDPSRRETLHRDAGGDDLEECAVCYLSVLLSDRLPDYGRAAMLADMDAWGYSFRLGSATRWFHEDAQDALAWLRARDLVDPPTGPPVRE